MKAVIDAFATTANSSTPKDKREKALTASLEMILEVLPSSFYSNNDEVNKLAEILPHCESYIFNFYGKNDREKAKKTALNFCQILNETLRKAIEKWPKENGNKLFFCKLILTLSNSTLENFVLEFTQFMVKNAEKTEIWQAMLGKNGLNFSQCENFIVKVMNVVEKPSDLVIIFGDTICSNSAFEKFLTETVLIRRIQSPLSRRRHSYLVAGYLASMAPGILLHCFEKTTEYFHLQSKNTFNDFEQQKQTAITTVDLAKVIPKKHQEAASKCVTEFVAISIPNYLKLSDPSRAQLGMYVGETLIKLFPVSGKEKLIFDYDENDPMLHEVKAIVSESLESGEIPDALKPPPPPKAETSKKGPLHNKTILDSDDDEADGDEAYLSELNDYAAKTRHKTNQIPLLIDKLTEKNDVKKFFSGLHDLLEYLPNKWVPVHEISPQLVNRIINLDNRFKLPHFELYRQKILELIFSRRPELISHAVRLILSPHCEMRDRYFVLKSMIGAANYIATGKGLEEATKEAEEEMQTHQKESAFKKFEKITVQGEERVGKLLRASQALLKDDQAPEKRNMYLEYAPQFVYPLIQEEVEGLHLDFTKKDDAIFLARILSTAGILVGFAANAPTIIPMSQNLLLFIEKVKRIESEDVIESIVFCYSAIVQAMNPTVFFEVFGEEVCDWIEYIVALKESDVCNAHPRLREVIDNTAALLIHTVNFVKEDYENVL